MRKWIARGGAVVVLTVAPNAAAQGFGQTDLPLPYVERPLTLPEKALSPEVDIRIANADFGRFGSVTVFSTELGGSFGLLEDLTVEARPLGFVAGDVSFDYTRFQVGGTYRFFKDAMAEIGARFRMQLDNRGDFALNPSLPVRIHATEAVRIDTGLSLNFVLPTGGPDPAVQLGAINTDVLRQSAAGVPIGFAAEAGIPIDVAFQMAPFFYSGVSTGYGILTFEDAADASFMPLGFFLGGTVPGEKGPLVDIGASFGFPVFLLGINRSNPTTEIWTLGFTGRGYFQL